MPIYVYKHPTEERYEEIIQTMSEPHVFSKDGVEWKRVFLPTRCSISANADPFNSNSFVEKTANMKGTFGDMMDYSKELSEKRAEKAGGEDPIKRQHFNRNEKEVGKKHIADKKTSYENKSVKIDFD